MLKIKFATIIRRYSDDFLLTFALLSLFVVYFTAM
jgi:hypothetical protein